MFRWLQRRLRARGLVPRLSETDRVALEAGEVWLEADLFSGRLRLTEILAEPYPDLSPDELAFLEGPVEELCGMVDDWRLWQERRLPGIVWNHLREHGFFGLDIPPEYGGLGFSALGRSTVVGKLASHSLALSSLVAPPGSIAPAQLLLEYGTEEQKEQLLPRLARGEEIACFALAEPEAGSDTDPIRSEGVVFRGSGDDLLLRLSWSERHVALAPVATLLGLAFRLSDPQGLLGRGPEPGITCALISTTEPGVEIGRHHDPLGVPLLNGPTNGSDVVVPAEAILGGRAAAGQGLKMLAEAQVGSRALAPPARAAATAKATARVAGAYAAVRRQFHRGGGRQQGVDEPLARLAGHVYAMEAARVFTCGAIDSGRRPAVVSAMVKYRLTELQRQVIGDGMDVLAGAGICLGPRNLLGRSHIASPIAVTVDGANALHRSLLIFGHGILRSSPWAPRLLAAARDGRPLKLAAALAGQTAKLAKSVLRSSWLSLTRAVLLPASGALAAYQRRLVWAAALFALLADWSLLRLGGKLDERGALSGRFSDVMSWLYLALATLRRFRAEGERKEDLAVARWALSEYLARMQRAFEGILANFPGALIGALLRGPCRWWLRLNPLGRPPTDRLADEAAARLLVPGPSRDRLTAWTWVGRRGAMADLEEAFGLAAEARPFVAQLDRAAREGTLQPGQRLARIQEAVTEGLLGAEEGVLLHEVEAARRRVTATDSFSPEEHLGRFAPSADSPDD